MIIEVTSDASDSDIAQLCKLHTAHEDVTAWPIRHAARAFIVISGDEALIPVITSPFIIGRHETGSSGYWLVDRAHEIAPTTVAVGDGTVGDGGFWCAAGPCALESFDDAVETGLAVRAQGASAYRVGVFKPRTSPYNFQGKGRLGLKLLAELKDAVGLPIVTEVLDPRDVEAVADAAACLQVGTRNMTNQALLKELGGTPRPVLLKRGARASVEEWLRAAEFIAAHGNTDIILCARGVVSFDTSLRFAPDLGAIASVRNRTSLPVVFDPSHTAGRSDAVAPVALAAAAFRPDGLLIEAHVRPERTHRPGDGPQAFPPHRLADLLTACQEVTSLANQLTETISAGTR
ncbi:3-deoxy-7-phosphoheptulonate synthase [Hamadaea sp. NPDC051192]|uniref:3-deoxy-7-phosphoheptulonate synthase n=1 Tax=Hamadaea sp. NPDC051192 TaxID=3154940 RepID=UPI00343869E7